jgi:hypothetical protein
MFTIERYGSSAERAMWIKRDLTDPTLRLREVARRNGTSHSQVERVRDQDVDMEEWHGPGLTAFERVCQERDEYQRMAEQLLEDCRVVIRERDELKRQLVVGTL